MQTVTEQHLQAPVGLFLVFLQTEGIHGVGKLPGINVLRVLLGPVQKSYFLCYVNIYIIHLLLFLLLLFHCCHPGQRSRWQVDKEAICLSKVQQMSSTYIPSIRRQ